MPGYIDALNDERSRPAIDELVTDGWVITDTTRHDPYLNGDVYTQVVLQKGGRTLNLSLGTPSAVQVHPDWTPRGTTIGFVTWERLASTFAFVEDLPHLRRTP